MELISVAQPNPLRLRATRARSPARADRLSLIDWLSREGGLVRVALGIAVALAMTACAPAFSPVRPPAASVPSASPRPQAPAPIAPSAPASPTAPSTVAPGPTPAFTAPLTSPPPPAVVVPPDARPDGGLGEPPPSVDFGPAAGPVPERPSGAASESVPLAGAAGSVEASPNATDKAQLASPAGFKIALVLPLESPTFGKAAEAVAAGFTAAAQSARVATVIVPHQDGEVLAAFDKARAARAAVIVGPLLRDDLRFIATAGEPLPWTVALNQLDDGTKLPDRIYTLALSIEGEGRQIAQRLRTEGARDVAIVASDSALQRRFAASFASEWILQGGGPPKTFRLLRGVENLVALRAELARTRVDAIVLAADALEAAAAKPFLGHVAVYASSQVNEHQPRETANDLDGIRFVEVPWLAAGPEGFPDLPPREWAESTLDRLYALGFDAFHAALAFSEGAPQRLELDGATGHLSLGPDHRLVREGRFMQLEGGRPVPLDRF